jgi:hypothetical protein
LEKPLDLTDEESAALLRELDNIIENDRYPSSLRIRLLRGILRKFGPMAPAPPPPARPPTPEERALGERNIEKNPSDACSQGR